MAGKSTVAVCSLASSDTEYNRFISVLKKHCGVCVKYVHITSRILENGHDFSQYDGVILIHSVSRGRMSLTDVKDARYDTLLPHLKSHLGRDRVAVVVTGVERTKDLGKRVMEKQPTVGQCSAHVLFCRAEDPMNDDHLADTIESFIRLLPDQPKVREGQAKPSKATTECNKDNSKGETMTIQAKTVKYAGIDVKSGKDKVHLEVSICAEGSTRKTLLKTLSDDDLKDEVDFLIFQEKADFAWELLEASSITSFDPSSELIHCAVFIFRNGVPPNFTEDDLKSFEEIINGRTSPTDIEVSGKADESCLQQLLKIFLECTYNDHIVAVFPGVFQTASSLSGNQTQREREHQYEATLKKEARGRIQKLNRAIRTLKQEISCKEDKLATCEENIRVKQCEQKQIASDFDAFNKNMDGKYEELQSLNEDIEKAQQKLTKTKRKFQIEENAVRCAKKELNLIQEEKEQVSKELSSCEIALRKAKKEVNKREKIKEQEFKDKECDQLKVAKQLEARETALKTAEYQNIKKSKELHGREEALREEVQDLKQIQETKEQVSHEVQSMENDLRKVKNDYKDLQNETREAEKKLKQIQERKEQVSEELESRRNELSKSNI